MYVCNNCSCQFEEPKYIKTTYEGYYGVSDMFMDSHDLDLLVCPNCDDEDYTELTQCDECEDYFENVTNIDEKKLCEKCFEKLEVNYENY